MDWARVGRAAGAWGPDWGEVGRGLPLGAAAGILAYALGGFDHLLGLLACAVALDFATGVAAAFVAHQAASTDLARGVVKKLLYFAAVALAVLVDNAVPMVMVGGVEVSARTLVIWGLAGGEMLSIAENLTLAGIKLPKGLTKRLRAVQAEIARED